MTKTLLQILLAIAIFALIGFIGKIVITALGIGAVWVTVWFAVCVIAFLLWLAKKLGIGID